MSTTSPRAVSARAVLTGMDRVGGWQPDFYRDLHRHPELSFQEHRTAGLVADRLRDCGFEVHEGVGGTGVVGILRNGDGPSVLLRADMDALPVREQTGLPYASTETATDADGKETPVMHACGHDIHVSCLLGAATLLAEGREHWSGTMIALFQPAEELGTGAAAMVADGLADLVGPVDVALGQHVMPMPAGALYTRPGPVLSTAQSVRITVYGRGAHGSMPYAAIDPVVLAAMIVIRLQTVVSREVHPDEFAVLTVGSLQAGTKSNVIDDHAVLELNIRAYSAETKKLIMDSVRRIVIAECQASGSPREPDFELHDGFPLTENDADATERVRSAFNANFPAEAVRDLAPMTGSEDFSDIPTALGAPYCYWVVGGIDAEIFARAKAAGRVSQDIPTNHSPFFAPVLEPTLELGTRGLAVAALAWLGDPDGP